MTHPGSVAVIGGSVAGGSLVRELRAAGFAGAVIVIDSDPDAPYDRPPLTKDFLSSNQARPEAPWWDDRCTVVRASAIGLASHGQAIEIAHPDGRRDQVIADHVVIATGARPMPLPGQPDGVVSLRSAEDARALRAASTSRPRVAIVGAGAIGTELASSLHAAGCRVEVVDMAPQPLARMFGSHLGDEASAWIRDGGVGLHLGSPIRDLRRTDTGWVLATDATRVAADLVISAVGVRPAVDWLYSAGLDLTDGVRCDEQGTALSTSGTPVGWLHAIGDAAAWRDSSGVWRRREDWTSAQRQARRVAHTILGAGDHAFEQELPYFWTHQFGRRIQILGTPDPDGRLVQESTNPDRNSAFYSIQGPAGKTLAWVAINEPRLFAQALRGRRPAHSDPARG